MDELAEQLAEARRTALAHEAEGKARDAAAAWRRAGSLMRHFAERATTAEAQTRRRKAAEYERRAEDLAAGRITPQPACTPSDGVTAAAPTGSAARWLVTSTDKLTLADVAGLADVKAQLQQMILLPLQKPELANAYGVSVGGGLLLYGPPGTGKTLIAKALAAELKAAYFYVSAATLLSKWVSEAEQNVAQLFAEARRRSPTVIFIDELEALAGSRNYPESTGVMQRVLTQLLQEMDGFKGRPEKLLILGATNRPWDIDEAALRPGRFDVHLYVPLPDTVARHHILELNMRNRPTAPGLDLGALARRLEGWSGADLAGLCAQVARARFQHAASEEADTQPTAISNADFVAAITTARPSVASDMLAAFDRWQERR